MNVIQPNCRVQFTADDIAFIMAVLGKKDDAPSLVALLTDPETRDLILDNDALFHALLEQRGCLRVSGHFYFYVLVRHVLRQTGLDDRSVADYVAEMLTEFSRAERSRLVAPGHAGPLDYFFEMLAALQTADDRTAFYIRAHIGNHSLFLSGVFPERIRFRAEARGFPDLKYYEALGRTQYRAASDHRLAHRYELAGIFSTLADRFETTRLAMRMLVKCMYHVHVEGIENVPAGGADSPYWLSPQQITPPSGVSPQVWRPPVEIWVKVPAGAVACPKSFAPEQVTLPSPRSPQTNPTRAEIWVKPFLPSVAS